MGITNAQFELTLLHWIVSQNFQDMESKKSTIVEFHADMTDRCGKHKRHISYFCHTMRELINTL